MARRQAYPELTIKQFKEAMVFSHKVLEDFTVFLRALGVPEE